MKNKCSMTKTDAIKCLIKGEKLTHRYFGSDEWIRQEGGYYYDENEYRLNIDEFWHYRQSASFEDGWEIFKPIQ